MAIATVESRLLRTGTCHRHEAATIVHVMPTDGKQRQQIDASWPRSGACRRPIVSFFCGPPRAMTDAIEPSGVSFHFADDTEKAYVLPLCSPSFGPLVLFARPTLCATSPLVRKGCSLCCRDRAVVPESFKQSLPSTRPQQFSATSPNFQRPRALSFVQLTTRTLPTALS